MSKWTFLFFVYTIKVTRISHDTMRFPLSQRTAFFAYYGRKIGYSAASLFVVLALVSYSEYDTCWDVANGGEYHNIWGRPGAVLSGFLFQWLGVGAWVVPIVLMHMSTVYRVPYGHLLPLVLGVLSVVWPGSLTGYPSALSRIAGHMGLKMWHRGVVMILCVWGGVYYAYRLFQVKKGPQKKKSRSVAMPIVTHSAYAFPPVTLLKEPFPGRLQGKKDTHTEKLKTVLNDFGINGMVLKANPGPIVTLYEFEPSAGVKSSRIISLSDDIARSMSALSVRVAPIPGKNLLGIELSNDKRETVYLRSLLQSDAYQRGEQLLPMVLGKDIGGEPVVCDLTKMPHLLVAGTTGSGKSVGVNAMILSLLYKKTPEQCRMIMIDPKMLELSVYQDIPHLLTPVITEPKQAIVTLKWVVHEMENRYRLMSKMGVRNIVGYNEKVMEQKNRTPKGVQSSEDMQESDPLPFIVVFVDEFADLMLVAGKEIETLIQRLAQMARASGVHSVMATQRPSVDVITGTTKPMFQRVSVFKQRPKLTVARF
jgi:hypothetical protein